MSETYSHTYMQLCSNQAVMYFYLFVHEYFIGLSDRFDFSALHSGVGWGVWHPVDISSFVLCI